jgi:G:T-mismatch repair DNA endonuclease (very short patch repair protein)
MTELRDQRGRFKKGSSGFWLGKKRSLETINKMRQRRLANPVRYWKGKKLSAQTKRKLSVSHKGQFKGVPFEIRYGLKKAQEMKENLRITKLGNNNPMKRAEVKEKVWKKNWFKPQLEKDRIRRKISEKLRGKHTSPRTEFKKGDKIRLGKQLTEETKRKIGLAHRRQNLSENTRRKMRKSALRRKQVFPRENTIIERIMDKELTKRQIPHENQVPILGICKPDHVIKHNGIKIAIFDDGDFWHATPPYFKRRKDCTLTRIQLKNLKRDKRNTEFLKSHGWFVLRFSESDIKQNASACIDKIEGIVNGCAILPTA